MSRAGKRPVTIPSGVNVELAGRTITVMGQKGALALVLPPEVSVAQSDGTITVIPRDETKRARQMWGTARSRIRNMVTGVSTGYSIGLEIQGIGYRAQVSGRKLALELGFSHSVAYPIPEGIDIKCEKPTQILVSGADRQKVGQVAAEIRRLRPPEPYKGKGIRYDGERVRRKEGKKK